MTNLVSTIDTMAWYGYDFTTAPSDDLKVTMHQAIYKADMSVIPIITKYVSDIFFDRYNRHVKIKDRQSVEDLCFFKNKRLIMGSISHEVMLNMDSDVFSLNDLSSYGKWRFTNRSFPEIPEIKSLII